MQKVIRTYNSEFRKGKSLLRIDLQHRQIVPGVAGDILRRIGPSSGQQHRAALAPGYHMVVGEDVAVLGDEKAAAAGGGLCRAAEDVRCGGHVDAHDAVDVGGVVLGVLSLIHI